jgi:hypothetical protein
MEYKEQIKFSFGFTDLQYGNLVYKMGREWINKYFGIDRTLCDLIERSPMFWAWWKNQWELRDKQFLIETPQLQMINEQLTGQTLHVAIDLYHEKHDIRTLSIHPNVWVVNEIRRIINSQHQSEVQKINALKNEPKNSNIHS